MKHSIIIKIGENLVYQQSPIEKPLPENSSSPVEYNRALPEWEHTSKNYLVKKADESSFEEFIDAEYITKGINIPYEFVETYEEVGRKFAKLNKNQDLSKINSNQLQVTSHNPVSGLTQSNPIVSEQQKVNNELRVSFEINIDDETGEPKIKFNNNNRLDLMIQKLLKSFAIKGISKGIEIISMENGDYEIKIEKD